MLAKTLPEFVRSRWPRGPVEWVSDGSYMVPCPVPDHGRGRGDLRPSLHLSEGDGGRLLWSCKAGCPRRAVQAALRVSSAWRLGSGGWSAVSPGLRGETSDSGTPRPPTPAATAEENLALLARLVLNAADRRHLRRRGLSDAEIDANGYRSLGGYGSGFLVPYRSPAGDILAFQVRSYGEPRYRWYGTGVRASNTPHVPLACRLLPRHTVRLVEGAMKADVVMSLSARHDVDLLPTVGVAGADVWRASLPVFDAWGVRTVRLSFDQDRAGRLAAESAGQSLKGMGVEWEVEEWDGPEGGLDEAILVGRRIMTVEGS